MICKFKYRFPIQQYVQKWCYTLFLDYEPLEILGRGLSSVVRRCLNRETHDEYAVKIIDLLQEEAPTIDEVQNEVNFFW